MKKYAWLLLLLPLLAFDGGDKYLLKMPSYTKESYFKKQVYAEHDWKSFYKLQQVNTLIDPDIYDAHLLSAAVFFATNKLRDNKGLPQLKFNEALRDAAFVHTGQMNDKNFFSHYNTYVKELKTPDLRVAMFNMHPQAMAENVDLNHLEPGGKESYLRMAEVIVNALYHSKEHRKNMMNKAYTMMGCSAIFEERDKMGVRTIRATQDFSN